MFNFFKRKEKEAAPVNLPFSTDIHSHILPGIDDGAPDIETSLELVKGLCSLGVTRSIATPHIIGDLYRNTPQTIGDALQKLKEACASAGISITLSAAAEYMLDDYFLELLRKNEPLLTLHKNIILTEIPFSSTPQNLGEIVAAIIAKGYRPILAHPERYQYYQQNFEEYQQLKEMGFLLQVNILSLTGYYGKKAEKAAKFIVEKNLLALVGTDMHHHKHLQAVSSEENRIIFQKYLGNKIYNDLDLIPE